jgi:hypothetical protein
MAVRRNRGPSTLAFALVGVSLVALAGCGEDDTEFLLVGGLEVEVDAASAGAVLDRDFAFADGGAVAPGFAGAATTVTFTSTSAARVDGGGTTLEGSMAFAPCTLDAPGAAVVTWDPCAIRLTRPADTGRTALVSLRIGPAESAPVEIEASVTPNAGGRTCTVRLEGRVLAPEVRCTEAGGSGDPGIVGPRG